MHPPRLLHVLASCVLALALAGCADVAGARRCGSETGAAASGAGARTVNFTVANDAGKPVCVRVLLDGELVFQDEFAPGEAPAMAIREGHRVVRVDEKDVTILVEETVQGLRAERILTLGEVNYVSIYVGTTIFIDNHDGPPEFA